MPHETTTTTTTNQQLLFDNRAMGARAESVATLSHALHQQQYTNHKHLIKINAVKQQLSGDH